MVYINLLILSALGSLLAASADGSGCDAVAGNCDAIAGNATKGQVLLQRQLAAHRDVQEDDGFEAEGDDEEHAEEGSARALLSKRETGSCDYCMCVVQDAAKCGSETVQDAAQCGTSYVQDAANCGSSTVTDGAKCGWDAVKSCDQRRRRRGVNKVKSKWGNTAKKCSIANKCNVANKCSVGKTCSVADSFNNCIGEISSSFSSTQKQYMGYVTGSGCTSISGCKSALKSGLSDVTDLLKTELLSGAKAVLTAFEGKTGVDVLGTAAKVADVAPTVATQAQDVMVEIGGCLKDIVAGQTPSFQKFDISNTASCSPSDRGFWYMEGTDCGAFSEMASIGLTNAEAKFNSAKGKFKECINKKGLLDFPTPFFDLKYQSYCLPDAMVTGLEYFMGALVVDAADWSAATSHATAATTAAGGCNTKELLQTDMALVTGFITDFASQLDISLLAKQVHAHRAGAAVGKTDVSGNCGSQSTWAVEFGVEFGVTVVVAGVTQTLGFRVGLVSGCKSDQFIPPNLVIGVSRTLGFSSSVTGASAGVTIEVTFHDNYPKFKDRINFGADLDITPEVDISEILGIPAAIGVPFSFGIYPTPANPSSFTFSVAPEIGNDLLQLGHTLRHLGHQASRQAEEASGNGVLAALTATTGHLGKTLAGDVGKKLKAQAPQLRQQAAHIAKAMDHHRRNLTSLSQLRQSHGYGDLAAKRTSEGPADLTIEAAVGFSLCITPVECYGQN